MFTFYKWTYVSKKERELFSKHELMMGLFHEQHHKENWLKGMTNKNERQATKYAFYRMMQKGYALEECLLMELSYRLYDKYGLTLREFIQFIKNNQEIITIQKKI